MKFILHHLKEYFHRILITGSSGQIGTNLGLLLQEQGHFVFGVDKRPNAWTADIRNLLQDLSTPATALPAALVTSNIPDYRTPWCI
ncbi:MAG: NAD-dependent epimerase/dehydratase family protein [Chloroflexi bacterium]|nr:NAD-dependent epimerase/dehydratase family protein [Chloroflexota bacterium]